MSAFGDWFAGFVADHCITDVVMLGDGRAPHAAAIEAKRLHGLQCKIWVVEHGYLRPNLILIEPEGMGGCSRIPELYKRDRRVRPQAGNKQWPSSFVRYAALDVLYHTANICFSWMSYPNYRAHSGIPPLVEYAGWMRKALMFPVRRLERVRAERKIEEHGGPLFLFPLQLSHDFQLTRYGTGEDQVIILRRILQSFVENAPEDAALVVKVHPLDNGWTNWARELARVSTHKPLIFLDGSDLDHLLARAQGIVTINSTVGLSGIMAGCATCVLGEAVYDLPGLTSGQTMDDFWKKPRPPEPEPVLRFTEYLRAAWHVPGSFDGPGSRFGAQRLAEWLAATQVSGGAGAA